jgi:hypothetical protein
VYTLWMIAGSGYRSTFGEMRSEFRNVFATGEGAALEFTTEDTSNGDTVSYEGVSILKIEGGKLKRVPPAAPGAPRLFSRSEDRERKSSSSQVIANCKPRLPAAEDQNLQRATKSRC